MFFLRSLVCVLPSVSPLIRCGCLCTILLHLTYTHLWSFRHGPIHRPTTIILFPVSDSDIQDQRPDVSISPRCHTSSFPTLRMFTPHYAQSRYLPLPVNNRLFATHRRHRSTLYVFKRLQHHSYPYPIEDVFHHSQGESMANSIALPHMALHPASIKPSEAPLLWS